MKITKAVEAVGKRYGNAVFKPGYPTGRGVYMVSDREQAKTLDLLRRMGVEANRVPCGRDWNYGGDLYALREAKSSRAKSKNVRR